jgi:high affinity Mn2+ porin
MSPASTVRLAAVALCALAGVGAAAGQSPGPPSAQRPAQLLPPAAPELPPAALLPPPDALTAQAPAAKGTEKNQPKKAPAAKNPPTQGPPSPPGQGKAGEEGKEKEPAAKNPPPEEPAPPGQEAAPEKGKDEEKEKPPPWYSAHGQTTVISQGNWVFHSPYSGQNSFQSLNSLRTTATTTLFLDARLWEGGEVIFNPEIAPGEGLSGVFGLGGFPNLEAVRVGQPQPIPYFARFYIKQTIELGGEWEKLEDAPNQIAGHRDLNRITISIGRLPATDIFDNNSYSHDPRSQLMNWTLGYNGAWDNPSNVRGYNYGASIELNQPYWAIRYGAFGEPEFANGARLDSKVLLAQGQALELECRWNLDGPQGKVRLLGFLNHAHMGDYREALNLMPVNPDVTLTRQYRFKYGFGMNFEQEINPNLGVWARLGWDDGHTETWAFTECDRTLAFGLLLKGTYWRRPQDQVGAGYFCNGLSQDHRNYLAAGGLGFELGDGKLSYALEQGGEAYYNWQLRKNIFIAFDVQGIVNPGYNRDRGPIPFAAVRVHFEY